MLSSQPNLVKFVSAVRETVKRENIDINLVAAECKEVKLDSSHFLDFIMKPESVESLNELITYVSNTNFLEIAYESIVKGMKEWNAEHQDKDAIAAFFDKLGNVKMCELINFIIAKKNDPAINPDRISNINKILTAIRANALKSNIVFVLDDVEVCIAAYPLNRPSEITIQIGGSGGLGNTVVKLMKTYKINITVIIDIWPNLWSVKNPPPPRPDKEIVLESGFSYTMMEPVNCDDKIANELVHAVAMVAPYYTSA
jgi:hypothetical protein